MPPTDDPPFDARAHLDRVRDQLRQAGPPPNPAELGEILQLRAQVAELEAENAAVDEGRPEQLDTLLAHLADALPELSIAEQVEFSERSYRRAHRIAVRATSRVAELRERVDYLTDELTDAWHGSHRSGEALSAVLAMTIVEYGAWVSTARPVTSAPTIVRSRWRDVCCTKPANHADAHRRITTGGDIDRWVYEGERETAQAQVAELEATLAAQETAINFETTCLQCGSTLDAAMQEAGRAERAERDLAALRGATSPWTLETDSCDCNDGMCSHGESPFEIRGEGDRVIVDAFGEDVTVEEGLVLAQAPALAIQNGRLAARVAELEAERDDYRFRLKAANGAYIAMSTKLDAQAGVQRARGDAAEAVVAQIQTAAEPIERDVQALEDALRALPADAPLALHAKGARLMGTALDVRRALDAAGTPTGEPRALPDRDDATTGVGPPDAACCGYGNPDAVRWNPYNRVVQCHNCGQVYAPTTQAPDGTHRPHRDDEVATWMKRKRDTHTPDSTAWRALDDLLDDYRLHADVGEPLDRDVHEPPCDRTTGCEVCCPTPVTPDGEATDG
jgi:uncharacterized protein YegP (UPF0339 family)